MDFAAAGLLDGLEGEERAARERLLEQLTEDGVSLEELRAAVAEDRLALLPVERVLGGRFTAREIERETGLPADNLLRRRRLLGLPEAGPEDRVFAAPDVDAARSMKLFLDAGLGEHALDDVTRVLGESMARLAATVAGGFVEAFLEPGDSEHDVARRFADLAEQLTPALGPVLIAAFAAHLREGVSRGILGRNELEAGQLSDSQELTICFADLVGFTRLGGELELEDLGSVAGRFAELAGDVTRPPVRLVKTIGDAAMFVSPNPAAVVSVALSLVEEAEAAELPALRAGLAHGTAVLRAGDFYGHPVNLASRVTGIARPGSVLCTEEIHDAASDEFDWSFAGRHRVKGISEPVALYRAHRVDGVESTDGGRRGRGQGKRATKRRADRPRRRASS
jgi:adenylate cyclase